VVFKALVAEQLGAIDRDLGKVTMRRVCTGSTDSATVAL
jgi:hypothetical protein